MERSAVVHQNAPKRRGRRLAEKSRPIECHAGTNAFNRRFDSSVQWTEAPHEKREGEARKGRGQPLVAITEEEIKVTKMTDNQTRSSEKLSRRNALRMLGLTAAVGYTVPVALMVSSSPAEAQAEGGRFGFGGRTRRSRTRRFRTNRSEFRVRTRRFRTNRSEFRGRTRRFRTNRFVFRERTRRF